MLRWLLERGHDANARFDKPPSSTLLIPSAASKRDAAQKVRVLLEHGAQVNLADDEGTTALLAASRAGNMQAMAVLAEAGADVNVVEPLKEHGRMTPLMYAANRGGDAIYMDEETGADAVKALLRAGANPKLRNTNGFTARELAKRIKNRQVAEVLDVWPGGR